MQKKVYFVNWVELGRGKKQTRRQKKKENVKERDTKLK